MSRRAAQHPRYPTGSVPRKTERIEATCGFCLARVSGEKNRCIARSTTADIPPLATAAILVSQFARGTNCGDVLASTRCVTRSGACAATHCPMAPPSDNPQKANCEIPIRRPAREYPCPTFQSNIHRLLHPKLRGPACRTAEFGSMEADHST
jgi:hypothetical protein